MPSQFTARVPEGHGRGSDGGSATSQLRNPEPALSFSGPSVPYLSTEANNNSDLGGLEG